MGTIETQNLNIQYRKAGDGAIPIVFVHGNYASSRWWLPQLERLPDNATGYAPDLRGCGSQEGITLHKTQKTGQLSIKNLSHDLAEFIQALALEKPILVGHSLGGVIATDFVIRFPEVARGLVLEDSGPPNGVPGGFLAQSMLIPLEFGSKILMRNALRLAGIPRRGDLAKALVQDALAASPGQYINFTSAVSRWNVEMKLSKINIPVLLVWGGRDRIMSKKIGRQYLQHIPQAELVIVPDAGHSPHLERPNAFAILLREFINQSTLSEIAPKPIHERIARWMRKTLFNSYS